MFYYFIKHFIYSVADSVTYNIGSFNVIWMFTLKLICPDTTAVLSTVV